MIDQAKTPHTFEVRILRQQAPGESSYWETYEVAYEQGMNVISVLQRIAAQGENAARQSVAPVAWDCNCLEEVCGACTMVVNGKVRQACTALVDNLIGDQESAIELRPMTKFPVLRDLVVDRERMFQALKKVKAWVSVDGYYDLGAGPNQSRGDQEVAYPLSQCMSCGCCLEACPQYTKIELKKRPSESNDDFEKRQQAAYARGFIGPHAISQAVLFNSHPIGKMQAGERLDALTMEGGLQHCGNAQNCVAVCPKEIPLTTSIARAGRATTLHALKKWFDQ